MSTIKATNFQHADAANPALVLAADGSATANVSSINSGPLAGFRNAITNGDMRIAQRGTSFAAIAAGAYSLDRWVWYQAGAVVCTVTQSTDTPNNTFQNSYKVDVTTADTSIAAGDYAFITQKIEGYNAQYLIGQTFTLSFWVKSPKTGTHCVAFRNSNADRSYVTEYTISSANTWEYKTITIGGGLITAGTWNWTNGAGILIHFVLSCGTTFQTTAGSWQSGNYIATSNQVNVTDSTANDFFLTGVQLEIGPVATPYERRPIGTELALCQRYYESSAGGVSFASAILFNGRVVTGVNYSARLRFSVAKRATPTVTLTNEFAAGFTATPNVNGTDLYAFQEQRQANATTDLGVFSSHWTASAEL